MRALEFDFAGSGGAASTPMAVVGNAAPSEWHSGLRGYQREDADLAWAAMAESHSTALVHPTGCGKTRTAAAVIKRFLQEFPGQRVLWLANRDFLCEEAARRIREATGAAVSIEKAEHQMSRTPVVVGSIQTLVRKDRRETIPRGTFGLIVYDECHHAVSPGSMAILEWFGAARRLGVTATLDRLDKIGGWNAWATVAAERSLDWAWDEGFLCVPVPVARHLDSVDISKIKTTAGDLNLGELEEEIAKSAAPIAHLALEEMGDRPALIYTPGVASAHAVAATMNQVRPGRFVAVDADTPTDERRQILRRYDSGDLDGIVNCGIYLEGLDVPRCACIVIARLTKSRSLYVQMAGRGSRPEGWIGQLATREERLAAIAASSKPNFKLVDITGKAGRHNLCMAADLSGKETPPWEINKVLAANPGMDLASAAKEARAAVQREQARIAALAQSAEVKARRTAFDLFGRYGVDMGGLPPQENAAPLTSDDKQWLGANKLPDSGLSHGDVNELKKRAGLWRRLGLATFKQRRTLNLAGVPTPHNLSFAAASKLIDHVISTHFRPDRQWVESVIGGRAA